MANSDERLRVLKMIEDGKITAAEGAGLLNALSAAGKTTSEPAAQHSIKPKRFRVLVTDSTGQKQVNINLPVGLVKVGLKMGARFIPQSSDTSEAELLDAIRNAVNSGSSGKVLEVEGSDGELIEILVE